jgi:hypothetical protein
LEKFSNHSNLGRSEATSKNRNWKISDFQIIQMGRRKDSKTGIEKSLIFKPPNFGKKEETIVFGVFSTK